MPILPYVPLSTPLPIPIPSHPCPCTCIFLMGDRYTIGFIIRRSCTTKFTLRSSWEVCYQEVPYHQVYPAFLLGGLLSGGPVPPSLPCVPPGRFVIRRSRTTKFTLRSSWEVCCQEILYHQVYPAFLLGGLLSGSPVPPSLPCVPPGRFVVRRSRTTKFTLRSSWEVCCQEILYHQVYPAFLLGGLLSGDPVPPSLPCVPPGRFVVRRSRTTKFTLRSSWEVCCQEILYHQVYPAFLLGGLLSGGPVPPSLPCVPPGRFVVRRSRTTKFTLRSSWEVCCQEVPYHQVYPAFLLGGLLSGGPVPPSLPCVLPGRFVVRRSRTTKFTLRSSWEVCCQEVPYHQVYPAFLLGGLLSGGPVPPSLPCVPPGRFVVRKSRTTKFTLRSSWEVCCQEVPYHQVYPAFFLGGLLSGGPVPPSLPCVLPGRFVIRRSRTTKFTLRSSWEVCCQEVPYHQVYPAFLLGGLLSGGHVPPSLPCVPPGRFVVRRSRTTKFTLRSSWEVCCQEVPYHQVYPAFLLGGLLSGGPVPPSLPCVPPGRFVVRRSRTTKFTLRSSWEVCCQGVPYHQVYPAFFLGGLLSGGPVPPSLPCVLPGRFVVRRSRTTKFTLRSSWEVCCQEVPYHQVYPAFLLGGLLSGGPVPPSLPCVLPGRFVVRRSRTTKFTLRSSWEVCCQEVPYHQVYPAFLLGGLLSGGPVPPSLPCVPPGRFVIRRSRTTKFTLRSSWEVCYQEVPYHQVYPAFFLGGLLSGGPVPPSLPCVPPGRFVIRRSRTTKFTLRSSWEVCCQEVPYHQVYPAFFLGGLLSGGPVPPSLPCVPPGRFVIRRSRTTKFTLRSSWEVCCQEVPYHQVYPAFLLGGLLSGSPVPPSLPCAPSSHRVPLGVQG